jgi:hypothetical protein
MDENKLLFSRYLVHAKCFQPKHSCYKNLKPEINKANMFYYITEWQLQNKIIRKIVSREGRMALEIHPIKRGDGNDYSQRKAQKSACGRLVLVG